MAGWFSRVVQAVARTYERRIRRASQISDYGTAHHHHEDDADDGGAEIANVAPGTPARTTASDQPALDTTLTPLAPPAPRPPPAAAPTDDDDDGEAAISNVAPGTPQRSAPAAPTDDDDEAVIVNL